MIKTTGSNHISDVLDGSPDENLERLYVHYHRPMEFYRKKYKRSKRLKLTLDMLSISLAVVGGVVGGVTLSPIVLGAVSGSGVLIQGYVSKSKLATTIEQCRFAYTNYKMILNDLRACMRGVDYDSTLLYSRLKLIDDIIADTCPPMDSQPSVNKT